MSNDFGKNHGKTLLKAKWLKLEKKTLLVILITNIL